MSVGDLIPQIGYMNNQKESLVQFNFARIKEVTFLTIDNIFNILSDSKGLQAFVFIILGIFFSLFSSKFNKVSCGILVFFIALSFVFQFQSSLNSYTLQFNMNVRKFLPSKFQIHFEDGNVLPSFVFISTIITYLALFIYSWVKVISILLLIYMLYINLESTFESYFTQYSEGYCLIFVLGITLIFYLVNSFICRSISTLFFSILGSLIIFLVLSNKIANFRNFKTFCENLMMLKFNSWGNPWFYVFICSFVCSYWIQFKIFKN